MSKKILAVTLGGNEYPSSNFRLRQYYPNLKGDGFEINEYNSKNFVNTKYPNIVGVRGLLRKLGYSKYYKKQQIKLFKRLVQEADVIWINKLLRDQYLIEIVKKSQKKVVLDFDDAEWMSSDNLFNSTLSISTIAIAGNNYLANYTQRNFGIKTEIIPTTIDLENYPTVKKSDHEKFVVGWLGSHFTNNYLLDIKDELNSFLKETNSEFHIISSKFEDLKQHFPYQTKFIEWNKKTFIDKVSKFNVGIMPMPNEEWVNGKCSFKMLQYMGAHIPVIVSPYGMNQEILDEVNCGFGAEKNGEWKEALYKLYNSKNLQKDLGFNGRNLVELKFDLNSNYLKIRKIFQSL